MFENVCELCSKGNLKEQVEYNKIFIKDVEKYLPLYFLVCDVCAAEQASSRQTQKNKYLMNILKKEVCGLVTGIAMPEQHVKFWSS